MKVLIADDDITSRCLVEVTLKKWGYCVFSVEDGDQAWKIMQEKNPPQLLILDWMMPGLDGLSLCKKLREKNLNFPIYIIMLTSRAEQKDIIRGLDAGADDFLTKPYDKDILKARVGVGNRVLELHNKLLEHEKFQGVMEMAGAVCHEMNQPLQIVLSNSELILNGLINSEQQDTLLKTIRKNTERIGRLTQQIMRITKYRAKDYLDGKSKIIDIEQSTRGSS